MNTLAEGNHIQTLEGKEIGKCRFRNSRPCDTENSIEGCGNEHTLDRTASEEDSK